MFPVKCKDLLPLDHLLIKSVAVRGRLGPLTVWVSNPEEHESFQWQPPQPHQHYPLPPGHPPPVRPPPQQQQRIRLDPQYWTKLYDKTHPPSRTEYAELVLRDPIRLVPGQTRVIYIHSTLPGDEAIVYDNSSFHNHNAHSKRYEDDKLYIQSGRAHVSPQVFGQEPIWGWGNAWRDRREFVGRLNYGTVYKLWSPRLQPKFGGNFQEGARTLFLCQRRWESPLSMLSDECIFYILNMCPWHHFDDDSDAMKARKKQEKMRLLKQQQEKEKKAGDTEMSNATVATSNSTNNNNAAAEEVEEDSKPAAVCASRCEAARQRVCAMLDHSDDDDDDEEEYKDCAEDEDDQKVPAVDEGGNVIVDLDDMEEYVPSENDDEEDDEDEWSEESEEAQYYRANVEAFTFQEVNSDSEDEEDDGQHAHNQREFMGQVHRMLFARRGIP